MANRMAKTAVSAEQGSGWRCTGPGGAKNCLGTLVLQGLTLPMPHCRRISANEQTCALPAHTQGIVILRDKGYQYEACGDATSIFCCADALGEDEIVSGAARHSVDFFEACGAICRAIDTAKIESLASGLRQLRDDGGRLFLLGVGGSAGNCGHAVNDFRKLCGIEAYAPTDNVSELTARANDEGWETIFSGWLEVSRLGPKDAILIYSVGGGDAERNVSTNLIKAIDYAKSKRARVFGIVGKDTGYTAKHGDAVVVVPQANPNWVTPLSEAFQSVVWHCLVSHPGLQVRKTKW